MTQETVVPRIKVEPTANTHCRHYHTSDPLLSGMNFAKFKYPLHEDLSDMYYNKRLGSVVGAIIVRRLGEIPGIVEVAISLYELQIRIDHTFSWDDGIDEDITEILKIAFGNKRQHVQIERDRALLPNTQTRAVPE